MIRRALSIAALALATATAARAQNPADEAWSRGDHVTARRLYAERLIADSSDIRALHRLALLLAWDGRYDQGIALFDRLLLVAPENNDARMDRARVLAWAGRFDASVAGWREAIERAPTDRQGHLGLAQTLAWANRLDEAQVEYEALLRNDPGDLEARQGLARLLAWRGRLVEAEAAWRDVLARDTSDAASRIGLSQTLRWQSRPDAARDALDRVPAAGRTGREYAEERRWVEIALGLTAAPVVTYETDSDDNRILTVALRGGRAVRPRVSVGGEVYVRTATYEPVVSGARTAWGVLGTGRYLFEPGWTVSAGLGVSGANGAASPTEPAWLLSASTPNRERSGATLTLRHGAFDATALIMDKGVTMTERSLGLRAEPATGWPLEGGASWTTFDGSASNQRLGGYLAGTRTIVPAWQAAVTLRSFGFEQDLNDGYFDPDFYFQGELIARWRPLRGRWQATAEAAPGLEQVRSRTDPHATLRLLARGGYEPAPGRQVTASVLYTNAGLQAFATGESGYRYLAFTLAGSWAF